MEKTNKGLYIIKKSESTVKGRNVVLTRKTNLAGDVLHGVVLENTRNGRHQKIGTFAGILPAWNVYKALSKK